jgi:hypothetical protein
VGTIDALEDGSALLLQITRVVETDASSHARGEKG